MTMLISSKQKIPKINCKRKQQGISMVELLVSMTLGLFLLAAVITNFVSTSKTDRVRDAISQMDANARTGMNILRQTIMHAGYPSIHSKTIDKAFYSTKDGTLTNPKCRNSYDRDVSSPKLADHITSDNSLNDVLTTITLADNPCLPGFDSCADETKANPEALVYHDCAGGGLDRTAHAVSCSAGPIAGMAPPSSPSDAKIYNSFVISNKTLSCVGSRSTDSQVLIENVEAIQYLYGLKRDDNSIVYRNATDVEAAEEWEQVVSVQVALLMGSTKSILPVPSTVTSYYLLDKKVDIDTADLRRVFNVYTSTIFLANKNRGGILNANN